MLTQPGIDTGDFCHTMALKPFYPVAATAATTLYIAATPYPFPLNVSTLLCYDTPLHSLYQKESLCTAHAVHCALHLVDSAQCVHQYGSVQLTAVHRRERT